MQNLSIRSKNVAKFTFLWDSLNFFPWRFSYLGRLHDRPGARYRVLFVLTKKLRRASALVEFRFTVYLLRKTIFHFIKYLIYDSFWSRCLMLLIVSLLLFNIFKSILQNTDFQDLCWNDVINDTIISDDLIYGK